MNHATTCLAAVTVLTGTALGGGNDLTTDQRVEELTTLVAQMRDEIRSLRADDDPAWLDAQRTEEIRSLVHDVLADADTRSSLLQSGMNAGYDGGFVLGSSDGKFSMKINGQLQVRYTYNSRDAMDTSVGGFENRRTKFKFKGHVGDPSWTYDFNWAASNTNGTLGLENAFIEKDLGDGWALRAGQFKLPFLREEMISSTRQLAAERSLVNEAFNQDFSQGVQLGWSADQFRWWVAYSDGFGSRNTRAVDNDNTEYAFTGRVEYLASGSWNQFKQFTAKGGTEQGLLFGAAAHFERNESGSTAPPANNDNEVERFSWTADVSMQFDGANIYAAVVGNHLEPQVGADTDQYGIIVQGGMFISDTTELFARYEWGDEDTAAANVDDLSVLTVGLNNYYSKHVKSTIDIGYAFDDISGTWASSSSGWRSDGAATDDGQFVVRGQLQLTF